MFFVKYVNIYCNAQRDKLEQKTNYIIKRLYPSHKDEVLAHFLRLDEQTIYNRFCAPLRPDNLKMYVDKIDFKNSGIFGVFDDNLNIIGLGECVMYDKPDINGNIQAEVGFSVEQAHQGKGLGNKLMKRIIRFAKSKNTHILHMYCLRTNQKSLHLAKKYGLKTQFSDGESQAIIEMSDNLPELEQFNEQIEDTLASIALIQKEQIKQWESQQKIINQAWNKMIKITFSKAAIKNH